MSFIKDGEPHIPDVMNRVICKRHGADVGEACWSVLSGSNSERVINGICNRRAKLAGYNGTISETSLRINRRR